MHKRLPLAYSTLEEYSKDAHGEIGNLAERRAKSYRVTFIAAEEAGLAAPETGSTTAGAVPHPPRHPVVSDPGLP